MLTEDPPYLMSFSRQAARQANGVEKGTVVHPECRGKEARNSSKEAHGISEIAGATCSKGERRVAPGFLGPRRWNCEVPNQGDRRDGRGTFGQARARAKVEVKIVE